MKRLLILSAALLLHSVFSFSSCLDSHDYSASIVVVNFVDSEITVEVDREPKDITSAGVTFWNIEWDDWETKMVTMWSMEYFRTIIVSDGENHFFFRYITGWEYIPPYYYY